MKTVNLAAMLFSTGTAAATLAACGGSQPPIGGPGAMPQTSALAPARTIAHRVLPASSYEVLRSFAGGTSDGQTPRSGLVDVNGTLYGTTEFGGTSNLGTVYRISTDGAEKVLHSFAGASSDGADPYASLLDVSGTLYGTTFYGGTSDRGTVYRISTDGAEMVLYSFAGGKSDGALPRSGLVNVKGTLYGTTASDGTSHSGTVYLIHTDGAEKVLYSFAGGPSDGADPYASLLDVSGTLYGTTYFGGSGSSNLGTVYSISTNGAENVLHRFAGGKSDGARPYAGLVNVNGTLYGTTADGGTSGRGTMYSISTDGAVKLLHSFGGTSDGAQPDAGLVDVSGTLYGTTHWGGKKGFGTVYLIHTDGAEKVLHSFAGGFSDGAHPFAGLVNVKGTLYGTTLYGGKSGCGTVFALTP